LPRKQNFSYQKFQREQARALKREAKKEQRARGLDSPETRADDDEREPDQARERVSDPATESP
jgi:hypothetical protein